MTFRFQARYALLTYAQCGDLDAWAVSDHLSELGAECIVARESHSDGGFHLHCFVDFGKKYRSRNVKIFDVQGFHPNIEPSKGRPWVGYDYAIKDGEVEAGGLERPSESDDTGVSTLTERRAQIVAATTRDEFWQLLQDLDPDSLLRSFPSCRAFAEWKFRPNPEPYITPEGITFDTTSFPGLDAWVSENLLRRRDRGK